MGKFIASSNVYHLILKKSDKIWLLFRSKEDKKKFLVILNVILFKYCAVVYAFVLMDTHVHILVRCDDVHKLGRDLYCAYSGYYCYKYKVAQRIMSWPVKIIPKPVLEWQLDTLYYILNNPVLAGICKTPGGYMFSSFKFYFGKINPIRNLIAVDTGLVSNTVKDADALRAILKKKLEYQKVNRKESQKVTNFINSSDNDLDLPPLDLPDGWR